MARLTINLICNTIAKKYSIDRAYIGMDKSEGTYHWVGEFSCLLSETEMNTHIVRLNDWTLEQWLESFDYRVKKEQENYGTVLFNIPISDFNQIIKDTFKE
ncbi:hypothetical protein I3271_05320 [Photobacterium leiognathi]|uniref:hypothetical protein n=1 Tax=Photobacterium leiognathi TaxID=553611 RepID=UPI001EDE10BC|nr:hypothetical protein [Photobacterium leiognathi]MCG3884100.1 hypothetical protein [Photobacterium leiognathi]